MTTAEEEFEKIWTECQDNAEKAGFLTEANKIKGLLYTTFMGGYGLGIVHGIQNADDEILKELISKVLK